MLRACITNFKHNWDEKLHLAEFAYNNSFQQSISMAPFEELYGRAYKTPIYWNQVGERSLTRPEMVKITLDAIK